MRKIIIAVFTTITLGLFAYWVYLLNLSIAGEFQQTYVSFDMNVPGITMLLLAILPYWWGVVIVISILSYSPILISNSKAQYLGVFVPILTGIIFLAALYAPVISNGSII